MNNSLNNGLPSARQSSFPSVTLFKKITKGGFLFYNFIMRKHGVQIRENNNFRLKNPFYADNNASMAINWKDGEYLFHDFGDEAFKGDVIEFAGHYYNLSPKTDLPEILRRACKDLGININNISEQQPAGNKTDGKQIPGLKLKERFSDTDLFFWEKYGIKKEILAYFRVFAVESYSVKNGASYREIRSTLNDPIFTYRVTDGCYKIYKPFDKEHKFFWIGRKPKDYIFGFEQLPENGNVLIITGGEKDVLTVVSYGYPCITLNSETSSLSMETAGLLRSRFKEVLVLYDLDQTGRDNTRKMCDQHGFKEIILPEKLMSQGIGKDVSDYFLAASNPDYASVYNLEAFQNMIMEAVSKQGTRANLSNITSLNSLTSLIVSQGCSIQKVTDLLKKDVPETVWIIKDLLPEGYSILGGRPKSGKSWLALNLGCSVALGRPFLDKFEVKKTGCLILALEDSEARLKDRIRKVLKNMSEDESNVPDNFHYLKKIPKLDEGGREILETYLEEHPDTRLVIVDTLKKLVPGSKKQFDYECEYAIGSLIQDLAFKFHVSILAILHTRKAPSEENIFDTISGTTGVQAAADEMLVLKRGKNHLSRLYTTGRDTGEDVFVLSFNDGNWSFLGEAENINSSQLNVDWEAIFGNCEMQTSELVSILEKDYSIGRATAYRWIREAKESGLLSETRRGWLKISGLSDDIGKVNVGANEIKTANLFKYMPQDRPN